MAWNDANKNGGTLGFEAEMFKTADKLRGNMDPSDNKHVALQFGFIVLTYISDAFSAKFEVTNTNNWFRVFRDGTFLKYTQ